MHPRNRKGRGFTRWNWVMFKQIAEQYPDSGALYRANKAAHEAGRRWGWLDRYYGSKEFRRAKQYQDWSTIRMILKQRAHHAASVKHQRRG